jgi:hypothetical protein
MRVLLSLAAWSTLFLFMSAYGWLAGLLMWIGCLGLVLVWVLYHE